MALLDELIQVTISVNAQYSDDFFERVRLAAERILKESKAGRTNQFRVYDHYKGLEEKATVLNYQELANALNLAWDDLSKRQHKLAPEFISLLLHLANDPVNKTSLDELNSLTRQTTPPPLTWAEIWEDEPYDEQDGLWDNVDFAGETSSEDDSELESEKGNLNETSSVTIRGIENSQGLSDMFQSLQLQPDFTVLQELKASWTESGPRDGQTTDAQIYTETHIVRETIFMLSGLPSDLFSRASSGETQPLKQLRIEGVSDIALHAALNHLATIGTNIMVIYDWIKVHEDVQFLQALQYSLSVKLEAINYQFAALQHQMLQNKGKPITILSLTSEVQAAFKHLLPLSGVVRRYLDSKGDAIFNVLDHLFSIISMYQGMGEVDTCHYVASIFFDAMKAYLKPIKQWMTTGVLCLEQPFFFVREKDTIQPLQNLWSDQFYLGEDEKGNLQAPQFLHQWVKKIFATGKSLRFIKALGIGGGESPTSTDLDFTGVAILDNIHTLIPFEEMFQNEFETWVSYMHESSTARLRQILGVHCGLWRVLDALEYTFFNKNGIALSQASAAFLQGVDAGRRGWNNTMILTGVYRDAFSETQCIDTRRLSIQMVEDERTMQLEMRSISKLACLKLTYSLPWTISNIIKPESLSSFQNVFTLILQVQRAKYLLDKHVARGMDSKRLRIRTRTQLLVNFLNHRLRWFLDTLQTYFSNMLPCVTRKLREDMTRADDIDEMIDAYHRFLEQLELRSLTGKQFSTAKQAIVALLELVVSFEGEVFSIQFEKPAQTASNRLESMDNSFRKLLAFAVSSVRAVSRSEGDEFLHMFAENLSSETTLEHLK